MEDSHEMLTFHPTGGIGDVNSSAKGSGARFNAGKPDMSLIPMVTLEDEARVWMYGKQKYSQRGDCTCSAGNAERQRGAKAVVSAEPTMKGICGTLTRSTQSVNEQTGVLGTQRTQSELRRSSEGEVQSEHSIHSTDSNQSTAAYPLNTVSAETSTTHLLPEAVPSAGQPNARMSITATQPESSGEFSAIPATLALDLSKGLTIGLSAHSPTCGVHKTIKTAAWNWTKGMPWSVPFACAMRHMAAWQRGEECDPESGLPHLAHAMCNLRMLTLYATTYTQGDDRPTKELQP